MSYRSYLAEIHSGLGYLATWLPSSPIGIGDVARLVNGELHRVCSIADFGIPYVPLRSRSSASYRYMTRNAVHLAVKGAASLLPESSTSVSPLAILVSFSRAEAIMFEAMECTSTSIADMNALRFSILKRHSAGEWSTELFVVTETVYAKSTTILISGDDQATLDLKSSTEFKLGAAKIFSVSAKLEATAYSGLSLMVLAESGLVPLYRAWGLKRRALGMGRPCIFRLGRCLPGGRSPLANLRSHLD
jgi:hypothetical protein